MMVSALSLILVGALALTAGWCLVFNDSQGATKYGWAVQPQQIHLSWAVDHDNCMIITWNTLETTPTTTAILFENGTGPAIQASGSQSPLIENDVVSPQMSDMVWSALAMVGQVRFSGKRTQYVHRVNACGLKHSTRYSYKVGDSESGWSSTYQFTFKRHASLDSPLAFAVYGDLGDANSRSLAMIQNRIAQGSIDAVIHVGDFAYDLNDNGGRVGDDFMNDIQPISTAVPYMTCPGNHESNEDFNDYRERFSRSYSDDDEPRMWYSFNVHNIHFISLSTEVLFFGRREEQQAQYEWLESDLIRANSNRNQRPWIIAFGHRPPYCSNNNGDDCSKQDSVVRKGIAQSDGRRLFGFEDLLVQYSVDLAIWAHEHDYERLFPMADFELRKGEDDPYRNPMGPVHVVTGSAGCKEDHDGFVFPQPSWSAVRFADYGFSLMRVHNDSHLEWEQFSIDRGGIVADHFWLVQTRGRQK
uniref:Purple acid phosphatase n=1 Tax=Spongospora subterranea TaxID=70186 RepID=A0A0H5R4P0_9EUKA|eukprot:CRZ03049.1 hypothetical protein [Spongospora subterranea]